MKKKMIGGILLTGLLGALIAGGTMAWFTDEAELAAAELTTGTVIVNTEGPATFAMDGKFIDNVNPGDCTTVVWDIINDGTKGAELRVKLSDLWEDELSNENVHYAPAPNSGWATYTDDQGETWFYYTKETIAGTYKDQAPTVIELPVVVVFDGEATGNIYQGKGYTIGGDVEAVQASNGAPSAVWGDVWEAVKNGERNDLDQYFVTGLGKDSDCWKAHLEDPQPDPVKRKVIVSAENAEGFRMTGGGSFAEGETVTITITPDPNNGTYFMDYLEMNGQLVTGYVVDSNNVVTYSFTMGNEAVDLVAHFMEVS